MTDPMGVAQAVIEISDKLNHTAICCWMGEAQVATARKLLEDAGIPAFRMPETAIELFHHNFQSITVTKSFCCKRRSQPVSTVAQRLKVPRC